MKTLRFNKILVSLSFLYLGHCGAEDIAHDSFKPIKEEIEKAWTVSRKPHYNPQEKSFGYIDDAKHPNRDETTVTKINNQNVPHDAVSENHTAAKELDSHGAIETAQETDLKIDPETVIFHGQFKGSPVKSSFRFIDKQGRDIKPEDSKIYNGVSVGGISVFNGVKDKVEEFLKISINLEAKQYYGDGKSSKFEQTIISPLDFGNNEIDYFEKSATSDSGTYVYVQQYDDPSCSHNLLCVEKFIQKPYAGMPSTLCFQNWRTNEHTLFPLGISPGRQFTDLQDEFRDKELLGYYRVLKYQGADVDCRNADPAALLKTSAVAVKIRLEQDLRKLGYSQSPNDELEADYAAIFDVYKIEKKAIKNQNHYPFIDQESGLQGRTIFFVDQDTNNLVLIRKTIRKPLSAFYRKIPFLNLNGVRIDFEFRLCRDLLNDSLQGACTETVK